MTIDKSTGRVTFVNYDTQDGVGGTYFNPLVALHANNGKYYFGGDQGLTEFSTNKFNSLPPIVQITDISISNKSGNSNGR